jgi:enoyl-CoA hydratase
LVAILEGKPSTPAQALANGAVDEVVPQEELVTMAIELAERFGSRPKGSVASIKRLVYFGGSMPRTDGLRVESTEFFTTVLSDDGQRLMVEHLEDTDATGELPSTIRTHA